ncbi:hypothetical protein PO124_20650 [Bacillus licheniformis]|nr:hypothetical protein [Bacillus licheniformis]
MWAARKPIRLKENLERFPNREKPSRQAGWRRSNRSNTWRRNACKIVKIS